MRRENLPYQNLRGLSTLEKSKEDRLSSVSLRMVILLPELNKIVVHIMSYSSSAIMLVELETGEPDGGAIIKNEEKKNKNKNYERREAQP